MTLWYCLVREDSNAPLLIHWDKRRIESMVSKGFKMVAVQPIGKNGAISLPLMDVDDNGRQYVIPNETLKTAGLLNQGV
jgi:hypothetical protein